jgi:hypothetical protein
MDEQGWIAIERKDQQRLAADRVSGEVLHLMRRATAAENEKHADLGGAHELPRGFPSALKLPS